MKSKKNQPTVSRRSFLLKSTLGAAAFTSGLLSPEFLTGSTGLGYPSNRFLPGPYDNDTLNKAKNNIPKIRMRDAEITLLDKYGQPLQNREVEVVQLKHQFLFGDNNWTMATMFRNGQIGHDRAKYYRKRFADVLNSLNTTVYWTERPRNDGTKTEDFQGDLRMDDFDESVDWANANGLIAKGHPICWTVPKAMPEWVKKYPAETIMKFLEVRVRNLCARYRGKVKLWDAVNEMLWETAPKNLPERIWPYTETMENLVEYIGLVLKWAREEDPDALYCINDYGLSPSKRDGLLDQNGDPVTAARQRKRFVELAKRLGDAGYPPSLIGDQSRPGWVFPSDQMAIYDELSEAGIPLSVTEFWANPRDLTTDTGNKIIESEEWRTLRANIEKNNLSDEELEEIRDEFVLNFLTCAFGHPNVHSFYFWGFMNGSVKFGQGTTSGHTMLPIYDKVRQLIHKEWKTRLTQETDGAGRISFRGFCGDYAVRVRPVNENAPPLGLTFNIDKDCDMNKRVFKTVL